MNISVISRGTTYPLDDGTISYVADMDGLGIPSFTRYQAQGAFQNGLTDKGFIFNARSIRVGLTVQANSMTNFYEKRQNLLDIFSPGLTNTLRITLESGDKRDIDVVLESGLTLPVNSSNWASFPVVLVLRCPEPSFYDPAGGTSDFSLGGGTDLGEIPLAVPMKVGASSIDATQAILYYGNWLSYPVITISGEITNPMIENETTNEILGFPAYSNGANDEVVIDCSFGKKTVIKNGTTNLIDELSTDSDLATFHLEPRRIGETSRSNSIRVTGSGVSANTAVSISYFNRYLGV